MQISNERARAFRAGIHKLGDSCKSHFSEFSLTTFRVISKQRLLFWLAAFPANSTALFEEGDWLVNMNLIHRVAVRCVSFLGASFIQVRSYANTMYDPRHLLVCTLCRNIVPVTDVFIFTDGMVFSPTKMKILLQEMGSKSVNLNNLSVRRCFQLYFLNVHYVSLMPRLILFLIDESASKRTINELKSSVIDAVV